MQREVAERLLAFLPPMHATHRVLEIGCGTGHLTRLLVDAFPALSIDAVDVAPRMIAQASAAIGVCARLRWHLADVMSFAPKNAFPVIVSSSALHWIQPISGAFERLCSLLEPGGTLVAALMVNGTLAELHHACASLFPGAEPAVVLPTADAIEQAAVAAGLRIEAARRDSFPHHYASAEALLRSLHRQGVTGSTSRARKLLRKSELRALTAHYDQAFATPSGGVTATWSVLTLRAQRALNRARTRSLTAPV